MTDRADPLAIDKSGPIRRFSESGLQGAVDRAVASLEAAGQNVAVLGVANRDRAGVAIVARIGSAWSLVAVGEREWLGGYKLEAAVRWSA